MNNILVTGVGAYLPKKVLLNKDLNKNLNTSDEWIKKRTGITQRHIVSEEETTSKMGFYASKKALENAKLSSKDIDLIILATTTPDKTFPASATSIQHELGIINCAAFDIQAVCAGFIYALNVASSLLKSGQFNKALVIGSESFSKILNWEDRATCVLFGDGAGAFVLEKSNEPGWGILSSNIQSDGQFSDILFTNGGPGTNRKVGTVEMNGKEVFKHAVEKLADSLHKAVSDSKIKITDIDYIVPHQANERIIDALAKKFNLPHDKIIKTVNIHANTSASSIPLAIDWGLREQKIINGSMLALNAIGGGLSWGASIIKFGKPDIDL